MSRKTPPCNAKGFKAIAAAELVNPAIQGTLQIPIETSYPGGEGESQEVYGMRDIPRYVNVCTEKESDKPTTNTTRRK